MIHPTCIVHPDARIDDEARLGPFCVIGPQVEIGAGTELRSQVTVTGPTRIAGGNRIFQFCSIGDDPQDKKYQGESESRLEIGSGNVIREYCSINRGTIGGGGVTRIGNDNWIMAYVHVAHDCQVGNSTVLANNATLAGHVTVEDYAILGGFTGVHQYCRVGAYSFAAIASVIVKDIPPYVLVSGNTARPNGLNREGLRRHGFSADDVEALRRAYRVLYREGLLLQEAVQRLQSMAAESSHVERLVRFISGSSRGIAR
ncbi:MAG: acyl-ACP--UDP-N-acetylglucosamine O-acyltransferase [Gammaproteobacteria bacterium]|nr:acyl-ACP--UDP-N-acetylglucosamine O-acyltransferase [Gammaproteobacteria bacterium]